MIFASFPRCSCIFRIAISCTPSHIRLSTHPVSGLPRGPQLTFLKLYCSNSVLKCMIVYPPQHSHLNHHHLLHLSLLDWPTFDSIK